VNQPPEGGDWEPAAEILSALQRRISGRHLGVAFQQRTFQDRTFKDREDDASQLNRLGVAYFLIVCFRFLPPYFGFAFFFVLEAEKRRRTIVSVFFLFRPDSGGREETLPPPQLSF
jgi:hypothetical protein